MLPTKVSRRRGRANDNRGPNHLGSSRDSKPIRELKNQNDYSLRQDALNSQRYNFPSTTDGGLRHRNVKFVTAGASESSRLELSSAALAKMTLEEVPMGTTGNWDRVSEHLSLNEDPVLCEKTNLTTIDQGREMADLFIIDVKGDESLVKSFAPSQPRSVSPTPSVSSDEFILFAGRDHAGGALSRLSPGHQITSDPYDARVTPTGPRISKRQTLLATKSKKSEGQNMKRDNLWCGGPLLLSIENGIGMISEGRHEDFQPQERHFDGIGTPRQKGWARSRRSSKRDKSQLMLEDYIANTEEQESVVLNVYSQRDLGDIDDDIFEESVALSGGGSDISFTDDTGHRGLGNFKDMSPSREIAGPAKILWSKQVRRNKLQDLETRDGKIVDDGDWVSTAGQVDPRPTRLIEKCKVGMSQLAHSYDDENLMGLRIKKSTAGDDYKDLLRGRNDYLTDEQIARVLEKEEELGRGSSSEVQNNNDMLGVLIEPKHCRGGQQNQANSRFKNRFRSTATSAIACDGFDLMDLERLNCNRPPKNRRGKLLFDVSDSDLETSMQMARANNQAQKRQRKEERQKLRLQGLLGQKNAKPDLKKKYQEGMTIDNVKDEIKNFLMSNNTTLALPPMDKVDRKVVHELANALDMKSRSAGTGIKRFPVLYRTSRTSYVASKFAAVEAKVIRRYLPRLDVGEGSYRSRPKRFGRGRLAHTAIDYRDGDIVGGSAPELGLDNKGRAMLQKMGWSTGTALGAVNNKGILHPVSQVIKTSRAGLS